MHINISTKLNKKIIPKLKLIQIWTKKFIKNNYTINFNIINKYHIKKLNKRYRNKNKQTDILSFESINKNLGDIFLCPHLIKKNNWNKTINHGLLHTLDYNHKTYNDNKIMTELENKLGMSGIEPPTITTSK